MNSLRRGLDRCLWRVMASGLLLGWVTLASAATPPHLAWAEDIALHVQPINNVYGTNPSSIEWPGVNGALAYRNRSECASFVTLNLRQAYGWSATFMKTWLGSTSPTAARYHDAIQAQNGFAVVPNVLSITAGDLVAIKYPAGLAATGHAMLADGPAVLRASTYPLVAGTLQYELPVIDASASGHGPQDTRLNPEGTWDDGAGRGLVRLYANLSGVITGYTWSTYSNSVYYAQTSRPLVVGRLKK